MSILFKSAFKKNIVHTHRSPERMAQKVDLPQSLSPVLVELLKREGIHRLYTHQGSAVTKVLEGNNVVITTGVASGKSLCYQIPILQTAVTIPGATSLLLFPTKALAQDQFSSLSKKLTIVRDTTKNDPVTAGIYDGDTPKGVREKIRKNCHILFTNPDMLHLGILPHHTNWVEFFRNLNFVIIDELHVYRGIFGSHVTNVIRRLKRIAARYGSYPQFICTSATLSNTGEFASRLIEASFTHISEDGSPAGEKTVYLYNPPIVNRELGIRANTLGEAEKITLSAVDSHIQTLVFTQSRRMVELILRNIRRYLGDPSKVQGYRSGYLPEERREIEAKLRDGEIECVISTNAMELGIDVGGLDLVVMVGYPGSIASVHQQGGRAGRKGKPSEVILVATQALLDQYILQNPEYIFERSPEAALINPDNPYLLLNHIQCAAFEIPFQKHESFGRVPAEEVSEYLEYLKDNGKLHESGDQYFWISEGYPADSISLRTAGTNQFILHSGDQTIGMVDEDSAYWLVHPHAVYLHNAESYLVDSMDLKNQSIRLQKTDPGYFTQSVRESEFELLELFQSDAILQLNRSLGEIKVLNRTVGYKKIRWVTNEIFGYDELDLPPTALVTHGVWFSFSPDTVHGLMELNAWSNSPNDYGDEWSQIRKKARERDRFKCTNCGITESRRAHDVHHKIPFRSFTDPDDANRLDNLVTLCHSCHMKAEQQVRIQSGLAGLSYILRNLTPFFLMCDQSDIRVNSDPSCMIADGDPAVILYDSVPGGIGLSEKVHEILPDLLKESFSIVHKCTCLDGCPACVGPVAENGEGSKEVVKIMLGYLFNQSERQSVS
ncbi:MAG: DEAD/DEAH box helicase [Fidelibacterota bacterium]